MKRIIFDANFLIDLAKFKINIDEIEILVGPCKFLTINSVINELRRIANKKTKASRNAKVALKLIESNDFEILKSREKNADEAILKLANKEIIVATNDSKLRKSLKRIGVKTIYLRAKKHLAID